MSTELFFTNAPYNCSDRELKEWIESRGIETLTIRIIPDLVSGASPSFAYASLKNEAQIEEAVSALNGQKMRNQIIIVRQAATRDVWRPRNQNAERNCCGDDLLA
jgi:RNA recognition motif-containing protein